MVRLAEKPFHAQSGGNVVVVVVAEGGGAGSAGTGALAGGPALFGTVVGVEVVVVEVAGENTDPLVTGPLATRWCWTFVVDAARPPL